MKKIVTFSLSVFSFLGLLKVFSIVPFNRMAADDFGYATAAITKGLWQSQINWYISWTGRFTSTFLQTLFGTNMGGDGKAVVYSVITFALLIFAFAFFYSRFTNLKIINLKVFLMSCVSFVALYILTPNKKESWYWMAGSVTYLWPIIFLVFGISFLFVKKPNKFDYALSFAAIFLAGGGNETLSLLICLTFGSFLAYSFITKHMNRMLLTLFIGAVISFALVYFAPGNSTRAIGGGSDQMNWFGSAMYAIQTGPNYLFSLVWNNLAVILSLVFCLAFIFPQTVEKDGLISKIFIAITAPAIVSVIYMLPSFRILGRVPPDRSDITLAFVLLISIVAAAYLLGQIIGSLGNKSSALMTAVGLFAAIMIFVLSFTTTSILASDVYTAKNYSSVFDIVVSELKDAAQSKKTGIITVHKLPESGLIGSADLKGYPDHEKNNAMAGYYGVEGLIAK